MREPSSTLRHMASSMASSHEAAQTALLTGGFKAGNFKGFGGFLLGITPKQSGATIDARFADHYRQHIQPLVAEFEQARLAALRVVRRRLPLMLPLLGLAGYGFVAGAPVPETQRAMYELCCTLGITGAMIALGWAMMPVMRYKGTIKDRIFRQVIGFFGSEWLYKPEGLGAASLRQGGHAMLRYMEYGIVPEHQDAHSEDWVSGAHKGVPLSQFECRLTSTRGSGKNRRTVVHFKGVIVELQVPKRFHGRTAIRRDRGTMGNWFGKQFAGKGLSPVRLEDPRFEERYEVYGTDQVEARYLLSPSFMERLMELEELFAQENGGRCDIQCAFHAGKLLVMLPSQKDRFCTGSVFKPVDFVPEINQVLQEMDQLFAIIDVLKLDDRTGL